MITFFLFMMVVFEGDHDFEDMNKEEVECMLCAPLDGIHDAQRGKHKTHTESKGTVPFIVFPIVNI